MNPITHKFNQDFNGASRFYCEMVKSGWWACSLNRINGCWCVVIKGFIEASVK